MNQKDHGQELMDVLLKTALSGYLEQEGAKIIEEAKENNADPDLRISPEEREMFYKLIDAEARKKKLREHRKRSKRILNRAAIIFLVVLVGFGTCMLTVDAFRAKFLNMFISQKGDYAVIGVDSSEVPDDSDLPEWASLPTYIPEGYLQISDSAVKNFGIYTDYFNESDNRIMTLAQQPLERLSLHIDTEDLDSYEELKIKGRDGILTKKDGFYNLTWKGDDYFFMITAQLSEDEVIKIAESVEIK